MCDIRELKAAAQGKPIIEDCAQALGSKLRGDRQVRSEILHFSVSIR
jgi:dTDP-4-amino-4,6-dideoxygalactose transaminase